jgi:hypothetical protein
MRSRKLEIVKAHDADPVSILLEQRRFGFGREQVDGGKPTDEFSRSAPFLTQ